MYFLAIATNIPQQLKTAFVVQGHIRPFLLKVLTLSASNLWISSYFVYYMIKNVMFKFAFESQTSILYGPLYVW